MMLVLLSTRKLFTQANVSSLPYFEVLREQLAELRQPLSRSRHHEVVSMAQNVTSDSDVPQNMAGHAFPMWIPPCSSVSAHVSLQIEAASCVPYMLRSSGASLPGCSSPSGSVV